jgi:adenine-specific DNA-methyltransferase
MYRYIGNKTRLTHWLISRINELAPRGGIVADPMCGTASVAEALRGSGYRVVASDIMTYAVHHARVRLLLQGAPPFSGLDGTYREVLDRLNQLLPMPGFYHREYSPGGNPISGDLPRKYLTAANAAKLDAINRQINDWSARGSLSQLENSLLRHDLVLAVNRVANIAGTYGHYRSAFSKSSQAPLTLMPTTFLSEYRNDHIVLQGPAEDLASEISADVCYIDPPYMKRQYAANYHLIETVARGDEPEAIGVSGLRPWRDQYSVFCTRTRIQDAFRRLVKNADCPVFLISYSSDGLLKDEELADLFEPLGAVSLERRVFPRFKSNQSNLGPHVTEYLITLLKANYERKPEQRAVGAI